MNIKPIKTRVLVPPQDDLLAVIKESVTAIPEKSILVVASKVVSIWEGRSIPMDEIADKDELVKHEAEQYIPREMAPEGWVMHTIKFNTLIPTAGIDESNGNGYYLLWPKDPMASAKKLYDWVRKEYGVKDVGILIADSHTIPLRRGTIGISLGWYGFDPLIDYVHKKDFFGREFKMTQANIPDGLSAAAVLAMGEGTESTPLALATDMLRVVFTDQPYEPREPHMTYSIPAKDDLYYPFLKYVPWEKGGGGE